MGPDREQILQELRFLKPPEVRGVSKGLLADMADIVEKWGTVSAPKQVVEFRSGDLGDDLSLRVSTSVDPEKRVLLVARGEFLLQNLVKMGTNLFNVGWDLSLTAKDAKEAVRRVDDKFASAGLLNIRTNQRIPLPPEQRIQKPEDVNRSVEAMFRGPKSVFLTKADGRSKEQILAEFDQPDKLEVVFVGGNAFVRLKGF